MKDKKELILYIVISLVSVALLAYVISMSINRNEDSKVVVPDFRNMTISEIEAWASENTILVEFTEVFSEDIPQGQVIEQTPAADAKIKKTDMIVITISKGPEISMVQLIDFSDMKVDEIQKFVEENGLTEFSYEYEVSNTIEKDYFIRISTDKTEVAQNEIIIITISLGRESDAEVVVADFSNYSRAQIENWKVANSVKINYVYTNSDTVAKDKLISQSPVAGTKVKTNSTITVTISYGPAITAKNFAGENKSVIEAWLKESNNRFKLSFENRYHNTIAEGRIISNSPSSGKITDNSTVNVVVSLGKPAMRTFVNQPYSSLESYIAGLNKNGANLKITRNQDAFSSTVPSGSIISQSVTSGTIDLGTTITVTVSKGKEPVSIQVKSFANQVEADIVKWIADNKLGTNRVEQYSDTIAAGRVISNTPSSGTVAEGASITYYVSIGKYTPPQFSGTFAEAQAVINAANGKGAGSWTIVRGTAEFSETVAKGQLISSKQTINGKQITVIESKGSSQAIVKAYDSLYDGMRNPNEVKTAIESELAAFGFTNYSVTIEIDPNGAASGVVFYQNLTPGTYHLDTEIIIKIAK